MPANTVSPPDFQKRLEALLVKPRERLGVEIKNWVDLSTSEHKAVLAQALLALVNFGGGYIVLGFKEKEGNWVADETRPPDLRLYSQDVVNGIATKYAEPSFHCDVYHVRHPELDSLFPVIVVPSGITVPVRAKCDGPDRKHVKVDTYYYRGEGPQSRPISSGREWDELIRRCIRSQREELLGTIRGILYGSTAEQETEDTGATLDQWVRDSQERWRVVSSQKFKDPNTAPYKHGAWQCAYRVSGNFQPPNLRDLLSLLQKAEGRETGWPPWVVLNPEDARPYPWENTMECHVGELADADFWRASPQGFMFLVRRYAEDYKPPEYTPGTVFDMSLPVWRTAECLLHAERFADAVAGPEANIEFQMRWSGLTGRRLVDIRGGFLPGEYQCHQQAVQAAVSVPQSQIGNTLPEIVKQLTVPLYEAFDLFHLPDPRYAYELDRMKQHR